MKLSILIPTRNRAAFLRDALSSVLAESRGLPDVEVLVSDNASSDETPQLLDQYKDQVTAFIQKKDLGMVGNWNFLLERAKGEFVKLMSDDDALLPCSLQREMEKISRDKGLVLVSSSRWEGNPPLGGYNSPPNSWGGVLKQTYCHPVRLSKSAALREMVFKENIFGTPASVMFRKSALKHFPSEWQYAADWAAWIDVLDHGDAEIIPEPNCVFRIHPDNLTKKFVDSDIDITEVLKLRKTALDRSGGGFFLKLYLVFVSIYRWTRRLARKILR